MDLPVADSFLLYARNIAKLARMERTKRRRDKYGKKRTGKLGFRDQCDLES